MTAQTQNTELQKVEEVTITLTGQDYLNLQEEHSILMDKYAKQIGDNARMQFEHSVKYEALQKKANAKNAELLDALSLMLSEHEAIFDRTGQFEPDQKFAFDYLKAATLAKSMGRVGDRIIEVHDWMTGESSLPFKRS